MIIFLTLIFFTCIHLELLPYQPEEHQFIPDIINISLINKSNPDWNIKFNSPSIIYRSLILLIYQLSSNANKMNPHPYSSKWWTWPLLTGKWVLFWVENGRHLICMGSPLIWYPIFFTILISLIYSINNKSFNSNLFGTIVGYFFSLLPFILIPRDTFLYHYSIPLFFGFWILPQLIDKLPIIIKTYIYCSLTFITFLSFYIWNPLAYGLEELDFKFFFCNNNWA